MASKARLFGDELARLQIMDTADPELQKRLGRNVRYFDYALWEQERENIVKRATYAKFSQNTGMGGRLLDTGNKRLAEASPYDKLWGIGLRAEDPDAQHPATWRGQNLLGTILEEVRQLLLSEALNGFDTNPAAPSPPSAEQMQGHHDGIFEVNPATQKRLTSFTDPPSTDVLRSTGYGRFTPYAPADHHSDVLSVVDTQSRDGIASLPEHGPCLIGGTISIDDPTFTTRVQIHSGTTARARYACVALLDTGSPASFIHEQAWEQMKITGAATTACERNTPPRAWGGFGTSAPLQTTKTVRVSVQFLRGEEPTASLGVWMFVVPDGTMQHAVLLGRDSWMRFDSRSYATLPSPSSSCRTKGELTLSHLDGTRGASAFARHQTASGGAFHLRYAGTTGISLTPEPRLVEVDLVRRGGATALTGNYMVDMLPQEGMFTLSEYFVQEGKQFIPLAGCAELEPGDLFGVASAPLLRVSI